MNHAQTYWVGNDNSSETLVVHNSGWKSNEVGGCHIRTRDSSISLYLTHDQAWHLRDDLNKLLADGCPTTLDVVGLEADAYSALLSVQALWERNFKKKEVIEDGDRST